jgi:alkanesulfonate monooxygenase SsuD/methylene tetrahydromethanopterin reductase-like flavin-dependent oxidoreductase (luciferase family)
MNRPFELGLDTFGDRSTLHNGDLTSHAQVLREVVEEPVRADQVGLDLLGVGGHHRDDFAISAPEVLLGVIAGRTKRLKLGAAVTILSTDDPMRVFQRFATLSALSNGRAEDVLGRGSFTESFPLFGFDRKDYELLFEEKLELFAEVRKQGRVRWEGQHRPMVDVAAVYPAVEGGLLPTWVGVGGTPQSVVRAARYGFSLGRDGERHAAGARTAAQRLRPTRATSQYDASARINSPPPHAPSLWKRSAPTSRSPASASARSGRRRSASSATRAAASC